MKQDKNQRDTIVKNFISFTEEKPAESTYPVRDGENKRLEGSDLFSLFTANIIKQDVTFVR